VACQAQNGATRELHANFILWAWKHPPERDRGCEPRREAPIALSCRRREPCDWRKAKGRPTASRRQCRKPCEVQRAGFRWIDRQEGWVNCRSRPPFERFPLAYNFPHSTSGVSQKRIAKGKSGTGDGTSSVLPTVWWVLCVRCHSGKTNAGTTVLFAERANEVSEQAKSTSLARGSAFGFSAIQDVLNNKNVRCVLAAQSEGNCRSAAHWEAYSETLILTRGFEGYSGLFDVYRGLCCSLTVRCYFWGLNMTFDNVLDVRCYRNFKPQPDLCCDKSFERSSLFRFVRFGFCC
jgi:hypothetical protein